MTGPSRGVVNGGRRGVQLRCWWRVGRPDPELASPQLRRGGGKPAAFGAPNAGRGPARVGEGVFVIRIHDTDGCVCGGAAVPPMCGEHELRERTCQKPGWACRKRGYWADDCRKDLTVKWISCASALMHPGEEIQKKMLHRGRGFTVFAPPVRGGGAALSRNASRARSKILPRFFRKSG